MVTRALYWGHHCPSESIITAALKAAVGMDTLYGLVEITALHRQAGR